jgi:hypothetical protein
MAKFHEHLNQKSLNAIMPQVLDSILEIGEYKEQLADYNAEKDHRKFVIPLGWARAQEVGEPVARYVHNRMFNQATRSGTVKAPYTHHWYGYLVEILVEVTEDFLTDLQRSNMAGQLSRLFAANQLATRLGKGKSKDWAIRAWPPGLEFRMSTGTGARSPLTRDEQAIASRREAEEADKPVKTLYDISKITRPGPDAGRDEYMAYLQKVVTTFNNLNKAYARVSDENAELETMVAGLSKQLEALEANSLTGLSADIDALFN